MPKSSREVYERARALIDSCFNLGVTPEKLEELAGKLAELARSAKKEDKVVSLADRRKPREGFDWSPTDPDGGAAA